MKTQSDIEDRIRFLLTQELSRRVKEAETRLPHLCHHNHRQALDTRKTVEDVRNETYNRTSDKHGLPVVQTIGLCMLGAESPAEWQGNICEDPIDAQRCPYFQSTVTKDVLAESFRANIQDLEWVRHNMPELYGLLWALDTSASWLLLPFWKRLWFKIIRLNVAPVQPDHDVVEYLRQLPPPPPPSQTG
jgi:hypothetical protein